MFRCTALDVFLKKKVASYKKTTIGKKKKTYSVSKDYFQNSKSINYTI